MLSGAELKTEFTQSKANEFVDPKTSTSARILFGKPIVGDLGGRSVRDRGRFEEL